MRGAKQHHSWKLDNERRKRPAITSEQAATTSNNSPTNYMHEKNHTGI
jgi:hypothetical protein